MDEHAVNTNPNPSSEIMRKPLVTFGPSTIHGTGVFAISDIHEGELIEECPTIVMPHAQLEALDETVIYDYYFSWGADAGALALGYGSLYNHSFRPNARYQLEEERQLIIFYALGAISLGTEITVNYTGEVSHVSALWFEPR